MYISQYYGWCFFLKISLTRPSEVGGRQLSVRVGICTDIKAPDTSKDTFQAINQLTKEH